MRGDFTRFTFDAARDYTATLMQQGRVQLDADWNEQQAIHRHLRETADAGIIGRFGVPKNSPAFAITLASAGADLAIGQGRAFLQGQPVDNRATATLFAQPFLRLATPTRPGIARPAASGRYVAYLEVRDRHVTAHHHPGLRESALGGPDTATRLQTIWQVRLAPAPSSTARCTDLGPAWQPPSPAQGTMSAEAEPTGAGGPCILPPTAGYRALDNQLYRVEIHRPGPRDGASPATIKWSRENGSVATTVTASGQILTAASLGPDELLGFLPGQWVEITDIWMDLADSRGRLLRIADIDPATNTIEIDPATPVPPLDTAHPVILTRWDQQGAGLADGVPIGAAPLPLEAGLQLRFAAGQFRAGQFWTIPARTAIGGDTGRVEWPAPGGVPALLPPHGPSRRHAALALVDYNATTRRFTLVDDCRPAFPPLTDLDATDIAFDNTNCAFPGGATTVQAALDALCARGAGICTIEARPGDNLQARIDALPANTDARICLAPGRYALAATLRIEGKGHILFQGSGEGTILVAPGHESALRVANCASLALRDCAFAAGLSVATGGLAGAVAVSDCPTVEATACVFRTAAAARRGTSGLSLIGRTSRTTALRVTGCRFEIGHGQVGLLARDCATVRVSDNRFLLGSTLPGTGGRKRLERLIAELLGPATLVRGTGTTGRSVTVAIGNRRVGFTPGATVPGAAVDWQGFVSSRQPPPQIAGRRAKGWLSNALRDRLEQIAAGTPATSALDRTLALLVSSDRPAMDDAIIVGGRQAADVAITGNHIADALRGITVATSDTKAPATVTPARRVRIDGNTIDLIAAVSTERRFGIMVGNSESVSVRENRIATTATRAPRVPIEGIRVWGTVGSFVSLRENHISGTRIGLRFVPIEGPNPEPRPAWTITDNLAQRATTVVMTPSASVRNRVRGIAENNS